MKKYMFLLSVSLVAASAGMAQALTAADQLKAMKQVFVADFQKMDDNKDNKLSLEEYLSHQFENFRANIIEADGFDTPKKAEDAASPVKDETLSKPAAADKSSSEPEKGLKSLADVNNALQEMADFDIDLDDGLALDDDLSLDGLEPAAESKPLTREDVMPSADLLALTEDEAAKPETKKAAAEMPSLDELGELDLSLSEDDSLKNLLAEINETPEQKAAKQAKKEAEKAAAAEAEIKAEQAKADAADRDKKIGMMLDTIKKTLPKKIDEVTTWTDIEYADKAIAYIYQADIDTATFSDKEIKALQNSIKTEACAKAYAEMCPKIKPVFIDEGVNMKIRYLDKVGKELSACEFNEETCR